MTEISVLASTGIGVFLKNLNLNDTELLEMVGRLDGLTKHPKVREVRLHGMDNPRFWIVETRGQMDTSAQIDLLKGAGYKTVQPCCARGSFQSYNGFRVFGGFADFYLDIYVGVGATLRPQA
jgi:hypothetical protein